MKVKKIQGCKMSALKIKSKGYKNKGSNFHNFKHILYI